MLLNVLSLLVLLLVAIIVFSILRNRVIAKMAYRNIFRRKIDTALILIGSLIGTALIVGSMGMNDSFQKFIYNQIEENFGEIDEVVTFEPQEPGIKQVFSIEAVDKLIEDLDNSDFIDGVLPAIVKSVSVGTSGNARSFDPKLSKQVTLMGVDFEKLAGFGSRQEVDFLDSRTEETGDIPEVIISKGLADDLGLAIGDTIELMTDPGQRLLFFLKLPNARVSSIIDGKGIYKYSGENMSGVSDGNIFLTPDDARKILQISVPNSFNELLISNKGNYISGEKHTDKVENLFLQKNLAEGFSLYTTKKDLKEQASQGNIGLLFLALSLFAILAGALLLTNIYTMLGEERRKELGTLRAIGYTKKKVARAILYEGFFYSIISSSIGVLAGLGIARYILENFVNLFSDITNLIPFEEAGMALSTFQSSFSFYVKPESAFYGFLLGLLIPLLVVIYTGKKISGMNIVAAVRGIPVTLSERSRLLVKIVGIVLISIALILAYTSYTGQNGEIFFVSVIIIGLLFPFVLPIKNKRIIQIFFSLGIIVFAMTSNSIDFIASQSDNSIVLVIAKGFSILFAGLLLVVYNLKTFEFILNKFFSRSKTTTPVFKVAIAFPARNHLRTGLTISMYALVIYIITLISIIPFSQEQMLTKSRNALFAGFDVNVFNIGSREITPADIENIPVVKNSTEISSVQIALEYGNTLNKKSLYVIDDNFIDFNLIQTVEIAPSYEKAVKAAGGIWNYLRQYPYSIVIAKGAFTDLELGSTITGHELSEKPTFGPPGADMFEKVDESDLGSELNFKVVGALPESTFSFFNGAFAYKDSVSMEFLNNFSQNILLINVNGSTYVEKKESYAILSRELRNKGSIAILVDDFINLANTAIKGMVDILKSFLYFGIVVGIIGIAIIMFKALYERKRLVGMLKAIGFTKKMVFSSFVIETTFIVLIGIALGFVTGSLTSYEMFSSPAMSGLEISMPWEQLIFMGLGFYLISLLVTLIPSYMASKLSPAEALRYFE